MEQLGDEQTEADKQLKGDAQNFRLLANTLPDLVFIIDHKLSCTYLNQRYYEYTGLEPGSGLGDGWRAIIHQEDLPEAIKLWQESLVNRSQYQCEQRLRGANAEYSWFLIRAIPVFDDSQNLVSWFGTCTDIQYRRRSREELEKVVYDRTKELADSKALTELILESISDAIIIADLDGNLTYVNKAARQLYKDNVVSPDLKHAATRSRLLQTSDSNPLSADELPLSRALLGEIVNDAEMLVREEGQSERVVSAAARPFIGADGEIKGAVAALRDITARKNQELALSRARDEARLANKLKSEFVANISHEIRTPMSGILGLSEILASETEGTSKEIAGHILSSAQNLMHLVNDLLDLSKLEAGKLDVRIENFSIEQIIDDVLTAFYVTASKKKIELIANIDEELKLELYCDGKRIRQVLQNLVQNALKFTDEGSVTVSVNLQNRDEKYIYARFSVRDTGLGISDENQKKLFQLFVQVDGSSTRRHGGTGLGLALSKRMVELMDGIIEVESAEGQGSTFWFSLPLLIDKPLEEIQAIN